MARVRLIDKEQASPEVKELYGKMEANGARIINLYRVLAHNSRVMRNHLQLGNTLLSKTALSSKLRELAILRIAKLAGSDYEWIQHYPIALEAGVTAEQADVLPRWQGSGLFTEEERAVLNYTDEVAQKVAVTEETFETLKQFLDEQRIVELTIAIGYWGMVARILVPLQVDIDEQSVGSASELTGKKPRSAG